MSYFIYIYSIGKKSVSSGDQNERISVYLDKQSRMSLVTKDYFVEQISHLS